jgi:hypothetical protein
MKNVVKITESDLHTIIKETLNEVLSETSRRQKAQSAILGKNRKVKTLAIISAENPMGEKTDKEYNENATNELIRNLTIGHYRYFQTKGLYETPENSIIVYNISLDDTLYLCYKYNQESVIFVDMRGVEISYQYWEGDDHTSKLKLQHEEHEVVDATNDKDYWTQICKKFKFRIPFFEDITKYNKELVECSKSHDVDTIINECLSNKTGYYKYTRRGKLKGFIKELGK